MKRTRIKRRRSNPDEAKCDALIQQATVATWKRCMICGTTRALCGHHVIGRSNLLRHDLRNMACVCEWCHGEWHAHRDDMDARFAELRPRDWEFIQSHKQTICQKPDYREREQALLAIIEGIGK